MNGFCDTNIKAICSNLCATLNFPQYINHTIYTATCSGSPHVLWLWFTYLLTACSRVLLEKPSGSQLGKKFPAFYGIWRFITAFTSSCQLDPVHTPHPNFWKCILMLSSHLCLGRPSGLIRSGFPTKTLNVPLPHMCCIPCPSISSWFNQQKIVIITR